MVGLIFGRFNPPTVGHELMINNALKTLKGKTLYVFISKTQDKKKNPLSVHEKDLILSSMYKGNKVEFIKCDDKIRTIIDALKYVNVFSDEVTVLCGADRVNEYDRLINKYNKKDYDFDQLAIKSMGARDSDADDVTGMSASKLRKLALDDDYDQFAKGMSSKLSDKIKKDTFNTIRNVLS